MAKTQKAQEYAEKRNRALRKAWFEYRYGPIRECDDWENDPVKPSDNFEKGFLSGIDFCEQSQWCSVEEELPETYTDVLIATDKGQVRVSHLKVARKTAWAWPGNFSPNVIAWMPIPYLPDTNIEKSRRSKKNYDTT